MERRHLDERRVSIGFATVSLCALAAACGPRPVELGFWFDPVAYQSPRIGEPLSSAELATIEQVARQEITRAFQAYAVTLTSNPNARYRVRVAQELKDDRLIRGGVVPGKSHAVAGFGGSGSVNFAYVANGAMVFAPADASRSSIIDSIGRGIGRVAVHEFAHQLLPKTPIDGSNDPRSYEGGSAATIEGYYGEIHWDLARPELERRIKRR
jgi:hypothetical protein